MPVARPHLLIGDTPGPGCRDLFTLRRALHQPDTGTLQQQMFQSLLRHAQGYLTAPPLTPISPLPGRGAVHVQHANRDYAIVSAAGHRVTTCALAALLTQDERYRDAALAQVDCLFDVNHWPDWRDKAHPWQSADLRTGSLAADLGLAYDWLHAMLSPWQRQAFVQGLDERAIQPYFQSIAQGASWAQPPRLDNWVTCIVGGLGVLGMALAEDHEESDRLVDIAVERMTQYLSIYGPKGEFNESPAYAASSRNVAGFFALLQCHHNAYLSDNPTIWETLAKHCRWLMYMTIPPGRIACFGDAHHHSKPAVDFFATVAAVTRDPVLQWFFLNHVDIADPVMSKPQLLLSFDPALEPRSPQDHWPLGEHFPAHGGVVSSRTDWDPRSAACVVTGKAGVARGHHGHHDAGQLCIDAQGQALIIDLGAPQLYPADYFGPQGQHYYNLAAHGHNILTIDQQHRLTEPNLAAHYLQAQFDNSVASWSIDLTELYPNVRHVRRDVIHLLPNIVAVLDQVRCLDDQVHRFDLRWHSFEPVIPAKDGSFVVAQGKAKLLGRVVKLDGWSDPPLVHAHQAHAYHPPFDRNRLGDLLPQTHEPYVQSTVSQSGGVSLLSLFVVAEQGDPVASWTQTAPDTWSIQTGATPHAIRLSRQDDYWSFASQTSSLQ
jgi:hypothetical protein